MIRSLPRICALFVLLFMAVASRAQLGGPPPPDPQAVLAAAKAASGGAAWDALKTQQSKVNIHAGGLSGSAERWSEYATGRSYLNYTIGPVTGAAGFDGKVAWSQDASGQSRIESVDAARELAVNAAYRDRLAFWYPERAPARLSYKERAQADGAAFDVIRITPEGGRPFELWINSETKLIERLVEREAQETRTETYMDVRDVAGVKIPFRVRASRGDPKYDELIVVESMDFNQPLTDVRFTQPAPPKPDFTFPAGKAFVEVPFEVHNGHLFLKVMVNGRGPVRMLFDTGGSNVLLPQVLERLGVRSEGALGASGAEGKQDVGMTRIDKIEFGGIVLERQVFATIDLDAFLRRVEGLDDIGGVVGYELFKRFPIKLDFERSRAVFHDPAKFKYAGTGARLPIEFRGTAPQVRGRVDDIDGVFHVDTGSRGSLTLTLPFVEENNLVEKYGAKLEAVYGAGVGGHVRARLARAKTLQLADVVIPNPMTSLSLQTTGALADPDVAGNIGFGILRQFNITFDYPGSALYLEKNANFGRPDIYDRAGAWIELGAKGFEVVDVVAGGPAAVAGLKAGDLIIGVNGKPWTAMSLSAVRGEFRAAPGRKLRLKIDGGPERIVTLRDLV
ncbi:MAG: aspartyl protease family protein [Betaproteobacteria bacterium]